MMTNEAPISIIFAGDSGDGIQLLGQQFTQQTILSGQDVKTSPDFPAEIRAPVGTVAGVSGFKISFADEPIHTLSDNVDVLVVLNPAALKLNLSDLNVGGLILINENNLTEKDFKKAGYTSNPLTDGTLNAYQVMPVPMTRLTVDAVKLDGLSHAQIKHCKNMFALGIMLFLYDRHLERCVESLKDKFGKHPMVLEANLAVLKAGYHYAETTELARFSQVSPQEAVCCEGITHITGSEAIAKACVHAADVLKVPLLLTAYPITPASQILEAMIKYQNDTLKTFQAEDEMAAACAAIGAAYGGSIGVTCTSGPGMDLKTEAIGLAVMCELPLVVVNVQRSGPSTGMPTKTGQSDLLQAVQGRHGECPVAVLAPQSARDCFTTLLEAIHIATTFMLPVIVLSDASNANSAEPCHESFLKSGVSFSLSQVRDPQGAKPYERNPDTLAPAWVVPGTPERCFRLGGLEKDEKGQVSYDPINHQNMIKLRSAKLKNIQMLISPQIVHGPEEGRALLLTWGSTYGVARTAVEQLQSQGMAIAHTHLRYLNPFPSNLKDILFRYDCVMVAELNEGQCCQLIRAQYLVDAKSITQTTGRPFRLTTLITHVKEIVEAQCND